MLKSLKPTAAIFTIVHALWVMHISMRDMMSVVCANDWTADIISNFKEAYHDIFDLILELT